MEPLVSILIPVYNRINLVGESIESAINQTYKNIEIVICDNCSTDGTWELLQQYSEKDNRIRLFKNIENLGPVKNWEQCLLHANGVYANFLWSDDRIKDTFIEHTIQLFDENIAFVMTGIQIFQNDKILSETKFQKNSIYNTKEYLEDKLLYGNIGFPMSPACSLFRLNDLRDAFCINIPNNLGLEFSKFGAGNDLLFFLITSTKFKKIRTTGTIESYFRHHENSLSIQTDLILYYNTAKLFFINNYKPLLAKNFESKLIFDKLIAKERSIFSIKINELDIFYLCKFTLKKIIQILSGGR
jgi:glycosyltransferase involved in cell wall biosynthesis